MQTVTTIGFDIAKSVFQVHGVDAAGEVVIRRQLKRRYVLAFFQKLSPCLVGIEACASSHYWSRELQALGHSVRLMPPAYVKPYVKRQKNDMADAEAICEAVTRANMRFVPTKTPEQQSCLMLHRTRHLFIRQQTAVINSIRAHLAEFGIIAPVGRRGVMELLHVVADPSDKRVPEVARACLAALGTQQLRLKECNGSCTSVELPPSSAPPSSSYSCPACWPGWSPGGFRAGSSGCRLSASSSQASSAPRRFLLA
jgi:transposase